MGEADLQEQVARIIDPSAWRVMDGYLADTLRKYRGQDAGYDPEAFKHKASLAKAASILALPALAPRQAPEAKSPTDEERAAATRLMKAAQNGKISGEDLQMIFNSRWVAVAPDADLVGELAVALRLALPILDDEFSSFGPGEPETRAIRAVRAALSHAEAALQPK